MQERCTVTYVGKTQPISGTFADSSLHAPSVSLSLPVYTYNLLSWAVFPLLGPPSARIFLATACAVYCSITLTQIETVGLKFLQSLLTKCSILGAVFSPSLYFIRTVTEPFIWRCLKRHLWNIYAFGISLGLQTKT